MLLRRINYLILRLLLLIFLVSCSETGDIHLSILETTDVHGVILPYDYIEKEPISFSLASAYTFIKQERELSDVTILLDNGDNLQGQPEVYFYNFIDTLSPHFLGEVMNHMDYDAGTVGNHDVEAGHSVYDRLVEEYNFPLLAANAVDVKTGLPYFQPYSVIKKKGIKVIVFGLVTPAIPEWLPPELYEGIEFRDMVETAKLWMPEILKEKPDLVIGLFHSGWDRSRTELKSSDLLFENGSAAIAYNVPGFDIIFNGHDHRLANEQFVNKLGDTLLILNGGSRAENIAKADIVFSADRIMGKRKKLVTGQIINVSDYKPDPDFISRFTSQHEVINEYVNRVIGNSSATISSREAYFGSSAFIDMIHTIQLEISDADISFAAPLSFDVEISKGPVTVGDMFKLYRFENMLYTMSLTGEEVYKYLEYSYSDWFNTMKGPGDGLLKLRTDKGGNTLLTNGRAWLRNQAYNFDSASGIEYTVDVSKPEGSRVTIKGFSDGRSFENNKNYRIAVNSYRGNGGGGHLVDGAGISKDKLRSRLISSTDRDLRYYILEYIEKRNIVNPEPLYNWKVIPEPWLRSAKTREYKLLFGSENY